MSPKQCLIAAILAGPTLGYGQEPSAEQLLDYIERSLSTCHSVTKVTREDTQFRVYEYTGVRFEFDLEDVNAERNTGLMVRLYCEVPACVSMYVSVGGKWGSSRPVNEKIWECGSIARNLRTVVRGYRKNY